MRRSYPGNRNASPSRFGKNILTEGVPRFAGESGPALEKQQTARRFPFEIMFKISASSEYALILAKHLSENTGMHTLEKLSGDTGIPLPMLRKVAAKLEKGGIVESKK